MDFELPYMAQRRTQAKRMGRLFPEDRDENEEDEASILFPIASDDEEEAGMEDRDAYAGAAALLGGTRSWPAALSMPAAAGASYPRPAPPPGCLDRLLSPTGLLAAFLPCLSLGRIATFLSAAEEYSSVEQQEEEGVASSPHPKPYFNAAGRRACLLATLSACLCPLPCLWPALWPMRRAQRRRIRSRYPHYPSLAPTSSSSSSSPQGQQWGAYLCFPCALAEEQAFLEAAAELKTVARPLSTRRDGSSKGRAAKTGAASPPAFDPEQGWDMRPIVDEAVEEEGGDGNGGLGKWK